MSRRSQVPPCRFLMLRLCRPVLSRVLILISSVLFPDRLERADMLAGFLFFAQLDRMHDRLKRADLYSPGFLFLVQLDLLHDRLKRADLFSSGFLFFVQLDLMHNLLKRADLYSPGHLFLVQLHLVRRSPDACRLTRLTVNFMCVPWCSSVIPSL